MNATISRLIEMYEDARDGADRGCKGDVIEQWRDAVVEKISAFQAPADWAAPLVERGAWSTYIEWRRTTVDADGDECEQAVKVRISNHEGRCTEHGRADLEIHFGRRDGKMFDPTGDKALADLPNVFAQREQEL